MSLHIILYQPEIPPNTGNIIRLCANTGANLHLVGPLGFQLDHNRVKRAGLDYAELARVQQYVNWEAFRTQHPDMRIWAFSTRGQRRYDQAEFSPDDGLLPADSDVTTRQNSALMTDYYSDRRPGVCLQKCWLIWGRPTVFACQWLMPRVVLTCPTRWQWVCMKPGDSWGLHKGRTKEPFSLRALPSAPWPINGPNLLPGPSPCE